MESNIVETEIKAKQKAKFSIEQHVLDTNARKPLS
jgi:hypothetical protein